MQATYHGGLTGKARSKKYRNRVERIRAQQLLDEYFEVEEDRPRQHVRLGGRADFLPTVDSWTSESSPFETGSQFELSLAAEEVAATSPIDAAGIPSKEMDNDAVVDGKAEPAPKPGVKVIPAPYWARPKVTFQPRGGRSTDKAFDVRRFLCGCALGSAAAAAILMIVSTVVH